MVQEVRGIGGVDARRSPGCLVVTRYSQGIVSVEWSERCTVGANGSRLYPRVNFEHVGPAHQAGTAWLSSLGAQVGLAKRRGWYPALR